MANGGKDAMSRAEQLAVASAVAPILRSVPEHVTRRRVKVYSSETGETLREATLGDALRGLAEAYAIEHTVDDAEEVARRTKTMRSQCLQCGRSFEYAYDGGIRSACEACRTAPCARGCRRIPPRSAYSGHMIRAREGRPWVCRPCAMKEALNRPETKARMSEAHRRRAKNTPESERARLREVQREAQRKAWADPEKRARARDLSKALARDPEWRAKTAEAAARGIAAKVGR